MSTIDVPEGWEHADDALVRSYTFADFATAMRFMVTAAPKIDAMNHHPEWTNVYHRVSVRLSSHDAGRVTERDIRLAHLLDEIAAELV